MSINRAQIDVLIERYPEELSETLEQFLRDKIREGHTMSKYEPGRIQNAISALEQSPPDIDEALAILRGPGR